MEKKLSAFQKYNKYFNERFQIIPMLINGASIFYVSFFFSSFGSITKEFNFLQTLCGVFTLFFMLMQLRMMDEHKDYKKDLKAHPNRMLSKGLITLRDLKKVMLFAFTVQLVLNIVMGVYQIIVWAIVIFWMLLMFKEFFIGKFLEKRIGLYMFTHQLLVVLMVFYGVSYNINIIEISTQGLFYILLFGFGMMFITMTFEIARKTWSKEREHEFADSYTKNWGIGKAVIIDQILAVLGGAVFFYFYIIQNMSLIYFIIVSVFYLLFLLISIQFAKKPTTKNSKFVELGGLLYVTVITITSAVGFAIIRFTK